MRSPKAILLYAAAAVLFALHQDWWLWGDSSLVFGVLPAGLLYHIAYCGAASLLFRGLTRHAWPDHLERAGEPEAAAGGRPGEGG